MLRRFHPIPERYGQTDRRTELLYQCHASVCAYKNFATSLILPDPNPSYLPFAFIFSKHMHWVIDVITDVIADVVNFGGVNVATVIFMHPLKQMSAGPSTGKVCRPVVHLTGQSTPDVGCFRQTGHATDSHSHWSQELCCLRSWGLEQFTTWTASVDTVHGYVCTTPESAPLRQHWMTCGCSTSDFT